MNEKILIVDDDPVCLTAYKSILQEFFCVDTARGGYAGLEKIGREAPYAVVISDMHMPDMDGLQFLSRVESMCPNTVKIMLTGHANLETAMAAVNSSHVFGFFSKSCDAETLLDAVREGIAHYQDRRRLPSFQETPRDLLSQEEIAFLTQG